MVAVWKSYYQRYQEKKPRLPRVLQLTAVATLITDCYAYAWSQDSFDVCHDSTATFEEHFYDFMEEKYVIYIVCDSKIRRSCYICKGDP
jgi:hypothetical protein